MISFSFFVSFNSLIERQSYKFYTASVYVYRLFSPQNIFDLIFLWLLLFFSLLFKINFTKTIIVIIFRFLKLFQVIIEIIWNTSWRIRCIVFKRYDYIMQNKHTKIITMRISLNNLQMRISSKKAYYQLHNTSDFPNSYLF